MAEPTSAPSLSAPEDLQLRDVLLRNGAIAQVRLLAPADEPALRALNARVSLRTRLMRYFSVSDRPGEWYVDHVLHEARNQAALVALVEGQVVAVASFSRLERDPSCADLALLVDDAHQSFGVGALLLEHLAHLARHHGVTQFTADVLMENAGMVGLLRESGFATTSTVSAGVAQLHVDLSDTPALQHAVHRREVEAERASLAPVLRPAGVAVVGSLRTTSVASQVHACLLEGGFTGQLHRLGRNDRLAALPGPLDLVVVAVPATEVLAVAADAAAAGAKGLVVLSAGFAEEGPAGQQRQQQLLELCRAHGLRLVGPNCLGIVNTDPAVRLDATFCDAQPRPGHVALISQSGAIGIAALRHAERRGAGLSLFVSTGNKADVSGNDLLEYLQDDPRTSVIALYLESFGNAQKFVRVASEVGRTKPVVVVKAGWTVEGARAGLSHTAAAATPAAAVEALLREAGVLRTDDLPQLFDVLTLLESGGLPAGPRLAVIGNSGGPGVLAADACSAAGLRLAALGEATRAVLARILPPGVPVAEPVDLRATVAADDFEAAVTAVLQDPAVDAVLAVYTPLVRGAEDDYAQALVHAHAAVPGKPLVAAFPGVGWAPAPLQAPGVAIPFFEFPEPAVHALGKVASYAGWRARPQEQQVPPVPTAAPAAARAIVQRATDDSDGSDGRWLSPQDATALLTAYGIPCTPVTEVADEAAAVAAAAVVGYPVALKAVGPEIVHKSAVGGVLLDLAGPTELKQAFRTLRKRLGATMTAAVVQPMRSAPPGACELLAGMAVDADLGPLVLAGLGGTLTDLAGDRVLRMPPRTREAARRQLGELRCAPRLQGTHEAELPAVADVLVALGRLARDLPQVRELDVNPLLVSAGGIEALDVRARVVGDWDGPDLPRRALNSARTAPLEER